MLIFQFKQSRCVRDGGGGGRDEWQRLAKLRKVAGCENGSWGQDSALNHGGEALPQTDSLTRGVGAQVESKKHLEGSLVWGVSPGR